MSSQLLPLNDAALPEINFPPTMAGYVRVLRLRATQWMTRLPGWAWSVPLLALLVLFLVPGPLLPWFVGKYAWTGKDFQEILGPSLLGGAVLVGLFQCLLRPSACRFWLLSLPAVLLCRELHFAGTGTGVYVALIAIVVTAVRHERRLSPIWNCRHICGCLFAAACLYGLAVSVDSGVWKFLPLAQWWGVNLEETLESSGHSFILAAILCGVVLADKRTRGLMNSKSDPQ